MTIEQELRLSYYRRVAEINKEHRIYLVQDIRNNKFYVRKCLTVYNAEIYRYLMAHPIENTPRIILAEEDDKSLTVVEEYIHGDTLEEILEQNKNLSEKQTVDIAVQLCTILSSFHRCVPAIVNRDIKPSNIKITPDGVVKLLDMNTAKWSNEQARKDTVLLGTHGYAAPEQYGFGASSVLTDIYSVGVLINVMLTGKLPNQVLAKGRLGKIVEKCIELSPSDRYQSVLELKTELEEKFCADYKTENNGNRRRYLPPGFRSDNKAKWILAAFGYAILIMIALCLDVDNASALEVILNRIAFLTASLGVVLFNGNYLNVRERFVMTKSDNRLLRWLGMAIADVIIFIVTIIILNVTVSVAC